MIGQATLRRKPASAAVVVYEAPSTAGGCCFFLSVAFQPATVKIFFFCA
jgi:hypothetical protein